MTTEPTPSETPETDDIAIYRAEWLFRNNAPKDWLILTKSEMDILKEDRNALRAQVAELTRERDTATEMERKRWQNVHADFMESLKKNATLTREVEQLREDKERLDWLANELSEGAIGMMVYIANKMVNEPSIRRAIDAAMSARSNEKETE